MPDLDGRRSDRLKGDGEDPRRSNRHERQVLISPFRFQLPFPLLQKVSSLLFFLAAALLSGTAIAGLTIAKRRLKLRRIIMIIIAALLVSWGLSLLIEHASEPSPPGEGPSGFRD